MDSSQFLQMDIAFAAFDFSKAADYAVQQMVMQSPALQTVPANVLQAVANAVWAAGVGTLPSYSVSGTTFTHGVSGIATAAYPWD